MPNIRILAQGALKKSCQQGLSIAIMAESKKGHNIAILGPTEKKILMLLIKFQGSTQIGFQGI